MNTSTIKRILFLPIMLIVLFPGGCQTPPAPPPRVTAADSPLPSPTPAEITPPQPTPDLGVQPYLDNVEAVLRHSAVVLTDRAVGIPDACPSLYLMAFPYTEPDQRGGMTIAVTGLKKNPDGSVLLREHQMLWGLKGEGMDPERCKDIFIQNRSEPGMIRITFQVQHPDDRSWRIGAASGPCPGIELWLSAYFLLNNPDDFDFLITEFEPGSPADFWLRDGSQLLRYHWEPWKETLLWTLDDVPGELRDVDWSSSSQDLTGDGFPDLLLTWEADGELIKSIYSPQDSGFAPAGEYQPGK